MRWRTARALAAFLGKLPVRVEHWSNCSGFAAVQGVARAPGPASGSRGLTEVRAPRPESSAEAGKLENFDPALDAAARLL